jgi:ABC-type phosphonate transport system ATPase subunit
LLSVRGLTKHFPVYAPGFRRRRPACIKAVDDVSFDLAPGESLGTRGRERLGQDHHGALPAAGPRARRPGEVRFRLPDGRTVDLARLSERELKPCASTRR